MRAWRWFVPEAILAGALILCAGNMAHATTIFSDNFETDSDGLNATINGWTVTNGTIDVVGTGFFNLCGGSPTPTHCIDTDGSTSKAGTMTTNASFVLAPGSYTLSFWARGNQRNSLTNELEASIAGQTFDLILPSTAPGAFHTFPFTLASLTSSPLVFHEIGGPGIAVNDNIGILLDEVSLVSAVPEPLSLLLVGTGMGALIARRRVRR